jgi:hypothetical protein
MQPPTLIFLMRMIDLILTMEESYFIAPSSQFLFQATEFLKALYWLKEALLCGAASCLP